MSYLLDGVRGGIRRGATTSTSSWSAPPSPRSSDEHPFIELDGDGAPLAKTREGPFQRGRVYQGGNVMAFQTRAHAHGERVLYVGDHIYGDILRSRKPSIWRTAMVLQELEHEITMYDRLRPELSRLDRLDAELIHLDSELYERQAAMRSLQKLSAESDDGVSAAKRTVKDSIEKLRRDLRETASQHRSAEAETDDAFNPYWGPLVPRRLRGEQVRRTGRSLRVRLHEPRLQLPVLLPDAVLPRSPRPHAPRTVTYHAGSA